MSTDAALQRRAVEAALAARLGSAAEARWVLDAVAGTGPCATVGPEARRRLEELEARRLAGEPLQYLLGTWAFRTLELHVDPRALIPRPETEVVAGLAMEEVRRVAAGSAAAPVVADLGTGTGAIALSVAVELAPALPGLSVVATDADPAALALAGENLARLSRSDPRAAAAVSLAPGDWYGALDPGLAGALAVVAGLSADGTPGLAAVEAVLGGARDWLAPGGAVVVELAPHQAPAAAGLAERLGFAEVVVAPDLTGRDRAVLARVARADGGRR